MATKKKTKSKASKPKTSKTAKSPKATKAKKAAKTAKKKASSVKVKATKKATAKKTNGGAKKKASAKKATPAKGPKKATAKAKKTTLKDRVKSVVDKVKSVANGNGKGKKASKKPVQEKPAEKEIDKVLAVEIPKEVAPTEVEEVVLTDSEGRRYCRVKDCDQLSTVDAYCRYHYLLFWKKIQIRKKILTEGKLEKYIEELTARYPDKYLDMLRKDLRSEKEFLAAIQELEIDDNNDENMDEEDSQSFIEEVRGISETSGGRDDDY